jgi:hypothetical protein
VVSSISGPSEGHIFVADQENDRINEFSAWGEFLRTWGWDVVASGPGDDTSAPEDQFEVCVPANGDVCKAGLEGGGRGQLIRPQGLSLDPNGNLYVAEGEFVSRRVQRFDPTAGPSENEVAFEWMIGGKVNKTKEEAAAPEAEQNLCPIAPTDVCQASTAGFGPGQFGTWVPGSYLATSPSGDTLYVGDQERIQTFDATGHYKSSLPFVGKTVNSLAADLTGNLYVAFAATANVQKISGAGAPICTIAAESPSAIAVDPTGGVYVVDAHVFGQERPTEIRQFTSSCADKLEPFGVPEIGNSSGIAAAVTCGAEGVSVYVSNSVLNNSFVRAYAHRPDSAICPPPAVPPTISAQFAAAVKPEGATLRAQINPHFWEDTSYYLEYGTGECAKGGCPSQRPLPPGTVLPGAGDTDEALAAAVGVIGLVPNTTYHYRFVSESGGGGPVFGIDPDGEGPEEASFEAGLEGTFTTFPTSSAAKSDCPNQSFRSGVSARLPDCRAYEMVSPVDKNNGDIAAFARALAPRFPTSLEQSSLDGEKITYSSATAFGNAISAPWTSQYLAARQAGVGWSTQAMSPPRIGKSLTSQTAVKFTLEYKLFSPDLCQAWLQHDSEPVLAGGAIAGYLNLYRRDNCGGGYEALTNAAPPAQSPDQYRTEVQGASADGSRSFFIANDKLTADAPSIGDKAQLYESSAGQLHFVCVLPDGSASTSACTAGTLNSNPPGEGRDNTVAGAISEDGSHVYWTAFTAVSGPGSLYLRLNPDQEQSALNGLECTEADKACTITVSVAAARFWAGAADGSRAIYSVGAQLREFDANTQASTAIAEGVLGVAGTSAGATKVYFASSKAIGGEGKEGQPNLYLHEAGEGGGATRFIATLSGEDVKSNSPLSVVNVEPAFRATRVSPDGEHLAFTSTASPTGYDNADANSEESDAEVYLYDAAADNLACVSCNPSGSRPAGRQLEIDRELLPFWVASALPGWETQLYASRALADDGSHLYFESYDALVARDNNGQQDVYEWERASNSQQCLAEKGAELYVAASGGCISLISSGESPESSEFADASPSGKDVFFRTASSLVPQDPNLIDLYDARVNGGLPTPPTPPPGCKGEACQSPPPPPGEVTPSSSATQGEGNVPAEATKKTCPKGKRSVRKNGKVRCVAKKKQKGKAKKKGKANKTGRAGR